MNEINIAEYAENSYLEYAMSVVKGRAIPSVEDGLKPVHRRIFFSMYKMGITDTSVPKKCARITGDVIGKYHPHGDVAVYDSMVVQAQTFRMLHPVIEGIGNFGSRDGDGAAAQRYTECKFYPISKVLFEELDQNAVDFVANYDGLEQEPKLMPARLPFILINTNEGIGVGMATNIPSHNLKEVTSAVIAFLENQKISLEEILTHIKGPDFPTGGQLISTKEEIAKIYNEGRGSFRLRGKYHIENPGTKKWKLVFTEIPYGVSVKKVLEEIDAIFNPEDKLKKAAKGKDKKISGEQARLKNLFVNLVDNFADESDKENPLRLVIEPKSYKQDPEELASILLGTTSLESTFSSNFVAIGLDGNPRQKNLMEIIAEWTTFRLVTIERRCRYHLEKIAARLHILDGRKIVLHHIDEVIQIVKNSKEPKKDLMEKYTLSEIQAQDVLELRLRQLGNLELESIENEYKTLLVKKAELERIISTPATLKKQAIKELKADMEKFGNERITEINEAQKVDLSTLQEKTAKVSQEEITVIVSTKGWIKGLKGQKTLEEVSFKEGDKADYLFHCLNTDTLAMFDAEGKVYNYPMHELTKEGCPINTLAQFNAKVSFVCPVNKDTKYLLSQDSGYGFMVSGENLLTKMKAGKEMITVADEGKLFPAIPINDINSRVALLTTEKRFVLFKLSDVSEIGKGKGVTLCGLPNGSRIKEIQLIQGETLEFKLTGKKTSLKLDNLQEYEKSRSASSKGSFLPIKDKTAEVSFKNES